MSDGARGTASKHSTRQEVEKLPRNACARCGMTGVSTMVKDGACLNADACAKRQAVNAAREQRIARKYAPSSHSKSQPPAPPITAPKEPDPGLSPELQAMLAQMDAEIAADEAKAKKKSRKRS